MKSILSFLKDWSMPVAMIVGIVFYHALSALTVLIPYLIFIMLLLTFAKLAPSKLRVGKLHLWLLLVQLIGSVGLYLLLAPMDKVWADSALICVLAPTATSAAVVTGLLGGSVACLTAYTLVSNVMIAGVAPLIFSLVNPIQGVTFTTSFLLIMSKVAPLLLLPLLTAWFLQRFSPRTTRVLQRMNVAAFWFWIISLAIVTAKTVRFLVDQTNPNIGQELLIAGTSLLLCMVQFVTGKRIGRSFGKTISGGQAIGQKNTILAIWMAQTFLSPVASLGPAAYVLWQNSFNSWQMWRKRQRAEPTGEED